MTGNENLFSPDLIGPSAVSSLDSSYTVRPLARNDYDKGYFDCLKALTWTGNVSKIRFEERFDWMRSKGEGWSYIVVIEHGGRIVGNGVLIADRKFIWDLATVGHIEEVSILESYQGKGLGKVMIAALDLVAENIGCCKTVLDCSPENEAFYKKCGYSAGGTHMSHAFKGFHEEESSSGSS